jgi:hemerythrin-like domain-containing protein
VTAVASAAWSELDVDCPVRNNGIRLDTDSLSEMVDYLIDHNYIAHTDTIYKQAIGMAMGVHNAPQMANLYCAHYELQYVLRRSIDYLTVFLSKLRALYGAQ